MEAKLQKNPNLDKVIAPIMLSRIALLSLQNKLETEDIINKRQEMILAENLHVDDEITYSQYQELYKKYGSNMEEKEFARIFLDIGDIRFQTIKHGIYKKVTILVNEYISNEEIASIKEKVITIYKIEQPDKIDYETFVEMYENFGGKLSSKMFVGKILETKMSAVTDSKRPNRKLVVLKGNKDDEKYDQLKLTIMNKEKIHIGEQIPYEKFQEIYNKYGNEISENEFAQKILEVDRLRRNSIIVFSSFLHKIKYKDIRELRERVILEENLHIGDSITKDEFYRLYEKYGGILPQDVFAYKILDIEASALNKIRTVNDNTTILNNIEIPEGYIESIREIIINENRLEQGQLISLMEFENLYKKYGYILSKKQFVTLVLDANWERYTRLENEENDKMTILINQIVTDFDALRNKVKMENNLQYKDRITYFQFQRLHKKYAPNMKETIFANRILDIDKGRFENFKYRRNRKHKTPILLSENIDPECLEDDEDVKYSIQEAEELKKRINKAEENAKNIRKKVMETKKCQIKFERKNKLKSELLMYSGKVKKVLDKYILTDSAIKNIKQYIELSKANFEIKSFPNEELDVLGEAIEFI